MGEFDPKLQLEANEAVQQFAGSLTLPIMYSSGAGEPRPVGSGTLLSVGNKLFIVTAAHLFEGCRLNEFSIPSARAAGRAVPLRGFVHRPRNSNDLDVAIVELNESVRSSLRDWNHITVENVARPTQHGRFVLCGYPTEYLEQDGAEQRYGVLTVFTERLSEVPQDAAPPVDPHWDLFFKYAEFGVEGATDLVRMPHLRGASGASVWQVIDVPKGELWAPSKVVKAIGIQASTLDGEWFRAKSWDIALDGIRNVTEGN